MTVADTFLFTYMTNIYHINYLMHSGVIMLHKNILKSSETVIKISVTGSGRRGAVVFLLIWVRRWLAVVQIDFCVSIRDRSRCALRAAYRRQDQIRLSVAVMRLLAAALAQIAHQLFDLYPSRRHVIISLINSRLP